jgi:Domain of unknown function (DUF4124)
MKTLAALLVLAALPPLARAEEVWRWRDANGTLCYSNQAAIAPRDAVPVKTRLIVEAKGLPGAPDLVMDDGMVIDARDVRPEARPPRKKLRRTYTEERLLFGCYASSVLFSGGWSHPDDITVIGNCLPYLLGPEAWLNAARAELALRQNGINWRQVVHMYVAQREPRLPRRVTGVSDED